LCMPGWADALSCALVAPIFAKFSASLWARSAGELSASQAADLI
jgi:hypothetical protein